jgi:tetratricopeptide (TPR) repeat protein
LRAVPKLRGCQKAEEYFNRATEAAEEIGAKGVEGQAYLNLGHLHKAMGRSDQARHCFSKAIRVFEECEADFILKQTKETLASSEGSKIVHPQALPGCFDSGTQLAAFPNLAAMLTFMEGHNFIPEITIMSLICAA